ncbi:MAG: acyl-CoA dehydrogenase family protein [Pseudomonadota bacterium]
MTVQEIVNKSAAAPVNVADSVAAIARDTLAPMVREIDAGLYPREVMRAFGAVGAYGTHLPEGDAADLRQTVSLMATAGAHCTSTAFCMWCQNALAWYVYCSDNAWLKDEIGAKAAAGEILGGTGLSNPMKTFFGIETMRLKARRVDGGYVVKGALPWVSNVEREGYFGIVFEVEGAEPPHRVMAVAHASAEGVKIVEDHDFVAMGGTATVAVQFRDALIEDKFILADPIEPYLRRIRAGFVLMQCGMALGMVQSCIDLMKQVQGQLGHVNKYLDEQPEDYEALLAELQAEVDTLAQTPFDPSMAYFRRVVTARLRGGEAAMAAAHYAMLHCGARGYVGKGVAQRRLREAYFIGIVTPATKQLKKMLAELPDA